MKLRYLKELGIPHSLSVVLLCLSLSVVFTVVFDSLGLTDNQNPYGVLPPIFARSMARRSGSMLADYVAHFLEHKRGKRSPPEKPPFDVFHGGER